MERIGRSLPPYEDSPAIWANHITRDILDSILKTDVVPTYTKALGQPPRPESDPAGGTPGGLDLGACPRGARCRVLEKYLSGCKSPIAGMLQLLADRGPARPLRDLFYVSKDSSERAAAISKLLAEDDPTTAFFDLESLDPTDIEQLKGVALSPISVVHLFRQYFFELDTFLGTSERHVWLSPGSSVELVEVHTRKTTIEKTVESTLDILSKSESATTSQDKLSEAVSDENSRDIKAGASVTASYASVQATASLDYASSQKLARETTHKRSREQTEKLSSEIRKNFKTTFKSTTEVTDTSSTRHLLANTWDELINYRNASKDASGWCPATGHRQLSLLADLR